MTHRRRPRRLRVRRRSHWTVKAWLATMGSLTACLILPSAFGQIPTDEPKLIETPVPKPPEFYAPQTITTEILYESLNRDLKWGELERAKRNLARLLAQPDFNGDKALELREKFGSDLVLRLRLFGKQLGPDAKKLADMSDLAAIEKARDPERIQKFLLQLTGSEGQRLFAVRELGRAGTFAIPFFLAELKGERVPRAVLINGMKQMPRSTWPAIQAILESDDQELVDAALQVLQAFNEPRAAPAVLYVAFSDKYKPSVRRLALQIFNDWTGKNPQTAEQGAKLLTTLANDFYVGNRTLPTDPSGKVEFWKEQDRQIKNVNIPLLDALMLTAITRTQQALELAPNYKPAQVLLLSLMILNDYKKVGVDKPLPDEAGGAKQTGLAAGPELLADVLQRAYNEKRTPVVLGAVSLLGETAGDRYWRADGQRVGLLAQALRYPHPRVQWAAVKAALNLRPRGGFRHDGRIVYALIRALDTKAKPEVIIADNSRARGSETAGLFRQLGFDADWVGSGREAFRRIAESSAVDFLVLEPNISMWNLPQTLANLRADDRTLSTPILMLRDGGNADDLTRIVRRNPYIRIVPRMDNKEDLAAELGLTFANPMTQPLTAEEKLLHQQEALDWIGRMAKGELPGFDVRNAARTIQGLLANPQLGPRAAEILGFIPSGENQRVLAKAVTDPGADLPTRQAAAKALAMTIQRNGRSLNQADTNAIVALLATETDPVLRTTLARLAGEFGGGRPFSDAMFQKYKP